MDDTIIGLDVGFSRSRRTSGIARLAYDGLVVGCATSEWSDRQRVLSAFHDSAVSALAAPLVGREFSGPRLVERALSSGKFQKRCKPGASHVTGTGQKLRAAGADTAAQLSSVTSGKQLRTEFPRIIERCNIVEASPNAFLGVCLGDDEYGAMPALRRGEKFDWLYDRWRLGGMFDQLALELGLADTEVPAACRTSANHDERGALVCLLTAGAVYAGRYVAIGDRQGGYTFLPPWNLWASWARREIDLRRKEFRELKVWIDGASYSATDELPPSHGDRSWSLVIDLMREDCQRGQRGWVDPHGRYPSSGPRRVEERLLDVLAVCPYSSWERTRDVVQVNVGGETGVVLIVTRDGLEVRLPTIEWTMDAYGPAESSRFWRRKSWRQIDDLAEFIESGRRARRAQFRPCVFCRQEFPPERMTGDACHECSSTKRGVTY